MKADRYDLALAAIAKDSNHPVIVLEHNRSYATDGYIFAERFRGAEDDTPGPWQVISIDTASQLRKQVPTGVKAVREGTDHVETDAHDPGFVQYAQDLFDLSRGKATDNRTIIRECINQEPALDICIDPELFAKAVKFLFDGHAKSDGRKGLKIQVYWAEIDGKTWPIYLLFNKADKKGRRVLVCGQQGE